MDLAESFGTLSLTLIMVSVQKNSRSVYPSIENGLKKSCITEEVCIVQKPWACDIPMPFSVSCHGNSFSYIYDIRFIKNINFTGLILLKQKNILL